MLWSYGTEECEQALKNGSVVLVCTGSRGVTIFGQCSAVFGHYNSLFGLRREARNDFKGTRNNNKPTTTIPVETVQHFNGGILNSRCGISGFVSY